MHVKMGQTYQGYIQSGGRLGSGACLLAKLRLISGWHNHCTSTGRTGFWGFAKVNSTKGDFAYVVDNSRDSTGALAARLYRKRRWQPDSPSFSCGARNPDYQSRIRPKRTRSLNTSANFSVCRNKRRSPTSPVFLEALVETLERSPQQATLLQ